MPSRLRQHAMPCIDKYNREVGSRGSGNHVSCVLLVAWRIGNDEFALGRGEKAVGDIDRDALLALRSKTIDEQRKIDILPLRSDPF